MSADLFASLVAVFGSVALLAGTIAWAVLRRHAPERKRLRELVRPRSESTWREPLGLTDEPNPLAERISRLMPRSAKRMDEMRQRLVAAGHRSQKAPVVFAASQIVSAIGVGAAVFVLFGN